MTTTPTPDVAHRLEFSVEVPGTPEQVWQAIATADGVSSWFMPTTVEEREGGAFITHMGETDSVGRVVRWDPPHHLTYEEPEWAALVGQDPATTTPLVTEMVVEARSGGTCVVRVVSSAFGTGADWEGEIMADMGRMWRPFFDNLGLYLTHFPGQHARTFECSATVDGTADRLWSALSGALGLTAVGAGAQARGVSGTVERLAEEGTFVRLTDPVPGLLAAAAFQMDEATSMALLRMYLFGDGAAGYVEREEAGWQAWLEGLAIPAG